MFFVKNQLLNSKKTQDLFNSKLQNPLLSIEPFDQCKLFTIDHNYVDTNTELKNEKLLDQYIFKDESVWTIVKYHNNNKGFTLSPGDYIKLGRARFKYVESSLISPSKTMKKSISEQTLDSPQNRQNSSNFNFCCRICLSEAYENDDIDNPYLSPCKCSGSMRHIHWKCLHKWMKSKSQVNDETHCLTFLWKNFKCELCKEVIPCKNTILYTL